MTVTNKRLVEILTTAMEKPEIANALIQRVINTLNQQGQETIAKWIKANTEHREWYICPKCSHQTPRFKDEWQGLTEGETIDLALSAFELPEVSSETREKIHRDLVIAMNDQDSRLMLFAANIEAKLKEKNSA